MGGTKVKGPWQTPEAQKAGTGGFCSIFLGWRWQRLADTLPVFSVTGAVGHADAGEGSLKAYCKPGSQAAPSLFFCSLLVPFPLSTVSACPHEGFPHPSSVPPKENGHQGHCLNTVLVWRTWRRPFSSPRPMQCHDLVR